MSDYDNPVQVEFGRGVLKERLASEFENAQVTIITSRGTRTRFLDDLLKRLALEPVAILDGCIENPTFDSCRRMYDAIDFERTNRFLGPMSEPVAILGRNAEQLSDDGDREGRRDRGDDLVSTAEGSRSA